MDICQYQKCSVRLRHQCFRVTHLFVVASSVLLAVDCFVWFFLWFSLHPACDCCRRDYLFVCKLTLVVFRHFLRCLLPFLHSFSLMHDPSHSARIYYY